MSYVVQSVGLFVLAGLCEIGGGYLVWRQALRGGKGWPLGLLGALPAAARSSEASPPFFVSRLS
mgnify:CR=1 FL=1